MWVYMKTTVEVQWGIYVQCGRHTSSGAYASNLEYIYTSASGQVVDCCEFMRNM